MPEKTERTEWRTAFGGLTQEIHGIARRTMESAQLDAHRLAELGAEEVRIQKRTVTETPWEDCEEADRGN